MKLGFNLEHSVPILNYTISRVLKIPFTKPRLQVIVLHIFAYMYITKTFFLILWFGFKETVFKN